MDMHTFVDSKFLKATDYPRPATLTIEQVSEELIGQDKERKGVMYFQRVEKALILNKTNIAALIEIMNSTESEEWIGKQVEIYTDPNVMYAGKRTPALRLRAPQQRTIPPQSARAAAPPAGANPTNLVSDEPDTIPDPGDPMPARQQARVRQQAPF